MDRQIKKHSNFVPKMFKMLMLYLCLTFAFFFGYIQFFGDLQTTLPPITMDDTSAEEEKTFGDFIANMMSFENIDAGFSLDFENKNENVKMALAGDLIFDSRTGGIEFLGKLTYQDVEPVELKVTYLHPYIYVGVAERTYKFDARSKIDFSQVVGLLAQTVDTNGVIDKIGGLLGIDLKNFDAAALMDKLDITMKPLEDGNYDLIIGLGSILQA